MGLGQAGLSFLEMFLNNTKNLNIKIKLKEYKDHAYKTKEFLQKKGVKNIEICTSNESFIKESDVIVSAVTFADEQIGKNEWFSEGCLLVPIHTRGFQNCDLFFDKVFADDTGHVKGFKYFNNFKQFNEIDLVLKEKIPGRENNKEKIISYNIGIALHDIFCAKKIYEIFNKGKS